MAKIAMLLLTVSAAAVAVAIWKFLALGNARAAENNVPAYSAPWPQDRESQEEEFWKIIERTQSSGNERAQLDKLNAELERLDNASLEQFIKVYDRLMHDTYSWDLWGAAYIINGGASDDAFEDFRNWLISNGRTFFAQAVAKPDDLAALIPEDRQQEATFEEFSYVAAHLWQKRTGRSFGEMAKENESLYPAEPIGIAIEEDPQALAKRYPKLWQRFGESPLF